jgi:hypothetical protein
MAYLLACLRVIAPPVARRGRAVSEWQPIETAPKDGTEILVYRHDCGILLARWIAAGQFLTEPELASMTDDEVETPDWFVADFVSGCRLDDNEAPTHWMPLPEPPK